MSRTIKNFGIDYQRELYEQSEEDYQFGAFALPSLVNIPEAEREKYLPAGERQNIGEEKMDCASRAPLNVIETGLNWLYANNLLSLPTMKFLIENGYVVDGGKIELSDAWIAIGSGTTRMGNSLKSPLQFIHDYGLIPKSMLPQVESFDDFHNPKRVTQRMRDLAEEFLRRIYINYEKVLEADFPTISKKGMLVVAGYAWPSSDSDGIYPRIERDPNHAFCTIEKPFHYRIFDNYIDSFDGDFIKNLASDYDFLGYGYFIAINEKKVSQIKRCWLERILAKLQINLKLC